MENLPLAGIRRILIESGANRVSEEATIALRDAVENIAKNIATESTKFANHAGRKTVKAEDVALACE